MLVLAPTTTLDLAHRYERAQDRTVRKTLAAALGVWRGVDVDDLAAWWAIAGPRIALAVQGGQGAAARQAVGFVNHVTDGTPPIPYTALAGVSGSGYPLAVPLFAAVEATRWARHMGAGRIDAATTGAHVLERTVTTEVLDTARAAESVGIAANPAVAGYVRMIEPGACARCAVLAGQFYRWNDGFLRHPRCRCVHIPSNEDTPKDPATDPQAYFDSLSRSEQDRIFTVAGAQAIRDGADIAQVVNARRGMSTAQVNTRGWIPKGRLSRVDVFGRDLFVTTEGMTRRGLARRVRARGGVRLMPESIYEIAGGDRAEAIRLLRVHGYIR